MTRKTRRRNKSQGADLEAQPEDEGMHITICLVFPTHQATHLLEEVRWKAAREMSTLTSGREGEASGTTGSNAPVVGADCELEGQAESSTRSQAQASSDGRLNPGEHSTTS